MAIMTRKSSRKEEASTGLRVKVFVDRVRVEAWDFKSGEMIKYQDFAR